VKKEYLQYSLEELIENPEFIAWVLRGKNQKEWESFLLLNPEYKTNVKKARILVELLRDRYDHLSEGEILDIWKNIEKFDEQYQKGLRSFIPYKLLRYAAILILLISVGTIGFWLFNQQENSYQFASDSQNQAKSQSHITLSNGTVVELDKENSKVALGADQQIVINNEKVIDLSKTAENNLSKMNEVVIPFGKKSQLILADGTKVWLNAGSRMAFPTTFHGKIREIFLDGEAYFEVTHKNDLPFVVNTGDIVVKVLGTRFSLSAYQTDELTETVLLEGKVVVREQSALGYLKGETILTPNQKASYHRSNRSISVKNEPDVDLSIAWIDGMFKFSQQSLVEVLNKLERYYNVQFLYEKEFPKADLISGKLDLKDSVEQVMLALSDVADLQYRINGEKIFIEKRMGEMKPRK
jgi:ferric-dicitrate binding protein FerR (iron transport regulator)